MCVIVPVYIVRRTGKLVIKLHLNFADWGKTIKRTQYPSRVLRPFCVLDMEFFSRITVIIRIMEHMGEGWKM